MKYRVLFVLIAFSLGAQAQLELLPDTVQFTQRTGGIQDTFDIANNPVPTAFDGGRNLSSFQALSSDQLFRDMTGYRLYQATSQSPLRYSSLPHLGFAYTFGSQGTQFLHLRYTQSFRFGINFNLDYDRSRGTGFLRITDFTSDDVRMRVQRDGQRYSMKFSGGFQSYRFSHAGGITTDPTVDVDTLVGLGLEFVPVRREASSETKLATAQFQNFVNFTSDSLNHFGLVTKHTFQIINRKYFENSLGEAYSEYAMFNYDSSQTQDSWNNPSIANGAGVYFLNKTTGFYLDGVIQHRYWNSWDVRDLRDTSEIDLTSELRFQWKGVSLKNSLRFNLIGGFNGWEDRASAKYSSNRLNISANALFSSLPADPIQRFYYGNHYDYELSAVNRQVWLKVGGRATFQVKDSVFALEARADLFSLPSVYVFNGADWTLTDTLGTANSLQIGGHLQWKFLHLRPAVVLSTDKNNYLPTLQGYSRAYVKGRLFKAKKLAAVIGVDVSYNNGFQVRNYVPSMDAFDWSGTGVINPGMFNMHFFASLGIEQFRFYLRFENIGYFWNDRTIQEANGYPIAGTRIRIGISWDFFN
jgi:hypothetical protein